MDKKKIDMLLKKSYRFISEQIEPEKITKIIPIAFPVLLSTWKIKVLLEEPSGLIDRYILRVLKDFGPCNIKRIDDFLCLGEARIKQALAEMEKLGSPISHSGDLFSFAIDGDIEHFHIEQDHDFSFCINGISGELLPLDFCSQAKNAEIEDLLEKNPLYIKFSPITSGTESKLKSLLPGKDAKKVVEGVPDGFVCLVDKSPRKEYCRYFLSFLVVTAESVKVFSAGSEKAFLTVDPNYFKQIPEIAYILEQKDSIEMQMSGIVITQRKTSLLVQVHDQALWNCFEVDYSSNQSIFFMRDFIRNGWLWDLSYRKFSHYTLQPADKTTEMALFTCRASFELEHIYSTFDTRKDVEKWLLDFFTRSNLTHIACPDLDVILKPLLEAKNSEVRDFAMMLAKSNTKEPKEYAVNKIFYSSTEENWKNCITDWLKKAQSSIQIISPVIESESIFNELNDASKRGVYLQVITSLLDRNGKIKDCSDKQFSSVKLPRQKLAALGASIRATKNVPHAKLIIIDEAIMIFTSANLNDNSLGRGKSNATEVCVVLSEASIVKQAKELFNALWLSARFTQVKNDTNAFVAQIPGKDLIDIPCFFKGKMEDLIFSCPDNLMLQKRIVQHLKSAKKEVYLMAMSFYDLQELPELYDVILELLKNKIPVAVLLRSGKEQFDSSAWPDNSTKKLLEAGIDLKEIPHLHAKGVIVDQEYMLLMSANFNPYSLGNLPTSHIEFGLEAKANALWRNDFKSFVNYLLTI